jgi:hypothetical protein
LADNFQPGDVLELADRHDLGSCAERREGSIPSVPIIEPNPVIASLREAISFTVSEIASPSARNDEN